MTDHYTITLSDGKYTVINRRNQLEFLRYGEAWLEASDLRFTNVVVAMAQRIEELETAIHEVVRGTAIAKDCYADDGMVSYDADNFVPFKVWEKRLRNALEQKQ